MDTALLNSVPIVILVIFFFEIFITFVFQRISDVNLFASKIGGGGKDTNGGTINPGEELMCVGMGICVGP